jgi:undecaprenyl-diphosphatase
MLNRLLVLDHSLSARLTMRRAGLLRLALQVVAHTGDGVIWIAFGVGLMLAGQSPLAVRVEVAVCALIAVVAGLKFVFRRRRPTGERGRLYFQMDAHSFPSGHAARVAALAIVFGALHPALAIGMGMWAVLVSLARVALGVHYLSDVVAGALLGVSVGLIVVTVL